MNPYRIRTPASLTFETNSGPFWVGKYNQNKLQIIYQEARVGCLFRLFLFSSSVYIEEISASWDNVIVNIRDKGGSLLIPFIRILNVILCHPVRI
jgi:hypothetical protein